MNIDANTSMLKASEYRVGQQLWRVVSTFHQGEFVKVVLEERHINVASVAKSMGISGGTFQNYFTSKVISDPVLLRMSEALKFDIHGIVKDELVRRMKPVRNISGGNVVAETPPPYERRSPSVAASGKPGYELTVRLEEFDEVAQLQILKFLQQQPRRGSSTATGT